jgi:phosphoglucosamine mutase
MLKNGLNIGGETSGHIILKDYQQTGDGMLAAVLFAHAFKNYDILKLDDIKIYPQESRNIAPATAKQMQKFANSAEIFEYIKLVSKQLEQKNMRAVVRASGTEPVIRIMVEAKTAQKAAEAAEEVKAKILDLLV